MSSSISPDNKQNYKITEETIKNLDKAIRDSIHQCSSERVWYATGSWYVDKKGKDSSHSIRNELETMLDDLTGTPEQKLTRIIDGLSKSYAGTENIASPSTAAMNLKDLQRLQAMGEGIEKRKSSSNFLMRICYIISDASKLLDKDSKGAEVKHAGEIRIHEKIQKMAEKLPEKHKQRIEAILHPESPGEKAEAIKDVEKKPEIVVDPAVRSTDEQLTRGRGR